MEVEARAHAAEQACAAAIRQQREEEARRAEAERVRTAAAAEAESLRQGFVHAQHELRRTCMALAGGMLGSLSLVLGTATESTDEQAAPATAPIPTPVEEQES